MSDSPPPGVDEDEPKAPGSDTADHDAVAIAPTGDGAEAADPAAQFSQYEHPPGYADYYSYYGYPSYGAPGYGPPPGVHAHNTTCSKEVALLAAKLVTHLHHACAGVNVSANSGTVRVPFICSC